MDRQLEIKITEHEIHWEAIVIFPFQKESFPCVHPCSIPPLSCSGRTRSYLNVA